MPAFLTSLKNAVPVPVSVLKRYYVICIFYGGDCALCPCDVLSGVGAEGFEDGEFVASAEVKIFFIN